MSDDLVARRQKYIERQPCLLADVPNNVIPSTSAKSNSAMPEGWKGEPS